MRPPRLRLQPSGVQALDALRPVRLVAGSHFVRLVAGSHFNRPVSAEQDTGRSDSGDSQHSDSKLVPDECLLFEVNHTLLRQQIYNVPVSPFETPVKRVSFR